MIGTRGIPAKYGGFETFIEEIGTRLAARGHEVTVYCMSEQPERAPPSFKGVRLMNLPSFDSRALEYIQKTFTATAMAVLSNAEILHFFGCSRVPLALLGRLLRKSVILTVDGLEWNRVSYPFVARIIMRSYAELAMVFPTITVADSESSQSWYFRRTGRRPELVQYGAEVTPGVDENTLGRYGLEDGRYILFVGRLVKEKGVHTLIEGFRKVRTDAKLVIIGNDPGSGEYLNQLKKLADERTVFLGPIYGRDLEYLRNGALVYVHPTLLDGTSISLLGAMAAGKCILSSNLKENMDVAGDSAAYFVMDDAVDLAQGLQRLLDEPASVQDLGARARQRAVSLYTWDSVADSYEAIYVRALSSE